MFSKRTATLAVAAAFGAATLGYLGAEVYPISRAQAAAPAATGQPARSLPDFTGLVETQGAAVVNISVVAQRSAAAKKGARG